MYFLTVSRYIELNPERAGMVEDCVEYPWSSYHANVLGEKSEMVTAHSCYRQLGRTARARQKTYLGLFETMIGQKTIDEINMATNKEWALENKRFKQQIEKQADRRVEPLGRGGDRKSKAYCDGNETQRL